MKSIFNYVCNNYNEAKNHSLSNHILGKKLRNDLPNKIYDLLDLDNDVFKVTGSVGQGQWAEIPWLSVFLKDITTTATNGYYIVYLFKSDMSGFYLSLNQGWTYFKNKYGITEGRIKIKEISTIMKDQLTPFSDIFNTKNINLFSSGPLGKGYELGHICGCYYDAANIPSDKKLISDLKELINEYIKLQKLISNRNTDEFNDFILLNSDNKFLDNVEEDTKFTIKAQEIIASSSSQQYKLIHKEIIDKPIEAPIPIIKATGSKTWPRNATIAANSIVHSDYKCTFNNEHFSFTSNRTNKPYMEPHHLIPLSEQANFPVSLDVEANIVSLCSTCHNCVHYGIDKEKFEILYSLFESRKDRLAKCGIQITFNDLINMYGMIDNIQK